MVLIKKIVLFVASFCCVSVFAADPIASITNVKVQSGMSAATAPCGLQTSFWNPSSSTAIPTTWPTVFDFSMQTGKNLVQMWISGPNGGGYLFKSGLINGLTGFAEAYTSQNSTDVVNNNAAILTQVECINNQVANLAQTLSTKGLLIDSVKVTCISDLASDWAQYKTLLADTPASAQANNDAASLAGNVNNLISNCSTSQTTYANAKNTSINGALFFSYDGSAGKWYQLLAANAGNNGMTPDVVLSLQEFLDYYALLEYEQAVLTSEYYNYEASKGKNFYTSAQLNMYGNNPSCVESVGAMSNTAQDFCSWQNNIASVWPGNIYSDEVSVCTTCVTNNGSIPTMSGIAVVAVPSGMTQGSNLNPQILAQDCNSTSKSPKCDFHLDTTAATNALIATYNATTPNGLPPNEETWFNPLAQRNAVVSTANISWNNINSSFFQTEVNSIKPGGGTASPQIPYLFMAKESGLESKVTSSNQPPVCPPASQKGPCQKGATIYTFSDISTNAMNPSAWGGSGTITPSKCKETYEVCSTSNFPSTPSVAYLLSRNWTGGSIVWPTDTVITSTKLSNGAQGQSYSSALLANGCDPATCQWNVTTANDANAMPPGLSLSMDGVLAGVPTTSGNYTFNVIVLGPTAMSQSTLITITIN